METLRPKETPDVSGGAQTADDQPIDALNPVWPMPYPPAPGAPVFDIPIEN